MIEVFSQNDKPYGKTWEEWTQLWWKWILAIPKNQNPLFGHDQSTNQYDENVFFLAASTGGQIEHTMNIPNGKSLLIPIINHTTSYVENPEMKNEQEMIQHAKHDIDDIVDKTIVISTDSGEYPLQFHRIQSQPFDMDYSQDNIFDVESGPSRGVSDGYWVFTKPLPTGEYKIHTFGSCSLGKTKIGADYDIVVS